MQRQSVTIHAARDYANRQAIADSAASHATRATLLCLAAYAFIAVALYPLPASAPFTPFAALAGLCIAVTFTMRAIGATFRAIRAEHNASR